MFAKQIRRAAPEREADFSDRKPCYHVELQAVGLSEGTVGRICPALLCCGQIDRRAAWLPRSR
jgi:hypothetical protein